MNQALLFTRQYPTATPRSLFITNQSALSNGEQTKNLSLSKIKNPNNEYILYINDSKKPLLERLCFCYSEFLIEILLKKSDLQTLLNFRRVSKALNFFASTINPYCPYNPLFEKAAVVFFYDELYPAVKQNEMEKWEFADKSKLELQIITPSLPKIKEVCKARNPLVKIIYTVENMEELNHLQTLFTADENSSLIACFKKLDFSRLVVDATNINAFNTLLTTISNNLPGLSSLTTIIIREVDSAVSLQLPDALNTMKIIFILNEEKGWFTLENVGKGLMAGVSIYSIYRYWFRSESKDEKKK